MIALLIISLSLLFGGIVFDGISFFYFDGLTGVGLLATVVGGCFYCVWLALNEIREDLKKIL